MTVNEFINESESYKCEGYTIVANTTGKLGTSNFNVGIKTTCKLPKQVKFIHSDGIELPIYICNGFRNYGIDLCEDEDSNFQLIKEFYLNPTKRIDYPSNPNNAIVKIVVDGTSTLESIEPIINRVKFFRDKIRNEDLRKQPLLINIETIKNDSFILEDKWGFDRKPVKSNGTIEPFIIE